MSFKYLDELNKCKDFYFAICVLVLTIIFGVGCQTIQPKPTMVVVLEFAKPVSVEFEGKSYNLDLVSTSSLLEKETFILECNGERKLYCEGDTLTFGALELFVDKTFITNVPGFNAFGVFTLR